jgi:hypothetical protein
MLGELRGKSAGRRAQGCAGRQEVPATHHLVYTVQFLEIIKVPTSETSERLRQRIPTNVAGAGLVLELGQLFSSRGSR